MAKLDLLFLVSNDSKNPHPPIAHIYVKEWGTHDYKGHEEDTRCNIYCLDADQL
jgi:hypothetical protein